MKKNAIVVIFCLLLTGWSLSAYSQTETSDGDGKWSNNSSWVGSEPSCPIDSIFILASDSIYVDGTVNFTYKNSRPNCGGAVHIVIYGVIKFKTGTKLVLPSGSTVDIKSGGVLRAGGGGGSAEYLEIGGNKVWTADDGDISGALIYTENGPLPIELISFNAHIDVDQVELAWVTSSEINNDFFTIERSVDTKLWEEVVVINGAGNSNQLISYYETDYFPYEGVSYYRLKQTDFNGAFTYSNIVPVKFAINAGVDPFINVFPSFANAGETISIEFENIFETEILVVIRDVKGREFYSKMYINIENGKLIGLPIRTNIPKGIYLITASSENQVYSQKLIVQ